MHDARLPTALITGATTGLGLALAKQLLAAGTHHLILTGRPESLERFERVGIVEDGRTWIRPLDVQVGEHRSAVISEVESRLGGLDVLVNNAGVAYRSVVEHVTERERLAQMAINFRAPMELIRLALPGMRSRRRGRIVTISSVAGMMAMPTMAVYAASKFALEGAHEALWYEVRPWRISVTLVQPGFIRAKDFDLARHTPLSRHATADPSNPYHAHYRSMDGFIEKIMRRFALQDHSAVARRVVRVMKQPRPALRVFGTTDAWLFAFVRKWLPRRVYHWLLYRMLPNVARWGTDEFD